MKAKNPFGLRCEDTVAPRIELDADHQGHLAVIICEYLNYIRLHPEEYLESDDTDSRFNKPIELADLFYFAGNVEGRMLSNNISALDLEIIESWELELLSKQSADT